jgi:hypothetical protein
MKCLNNRLFLVLFLAIFCFSTIMATKAQNNPLVLECEQHWPTYGVGGTCIPGTHNLFLTNIDDDAAIEIGTGGYSYCLASNGSTTSREAPLKIWNWNGQNITLETEHNWPGNINCVYDADVDNDGKIELLTSGNVINDSGTYPSLRAWSYDGKSLTLMSSVEGVGTSAISAGDVNSDGKPEIITIGRFNSTSQYGAKLFVWKLEENRFALLDSAEWCVSNVTSVTSLFADDLNGDGRVEIVTSGYAYDLTNSSGQLRVWQYGDEGLILRSNVEWRLVEGGYGRTIAGGVQGNTVVNNVKVGEVDSDGIPEIVTGGFAYDGENVSAQLRIWSWNGEELLLEKSEEWATDFLTEIKCVSLGDVDGDSRLEIMTSGGVGEESSFANETAHPNLAQLRVWGWDGKALTMKYSQEWSVGDGVFAWNVGSSDIDRDGVVEIVTVGCMGIDSLCDPDMRIWSVQNTDGSSDFLKFMLMGIIGAILVSAGVLFVLKKSQRKNSLQKIGDYPDTSAPKKNSGPYRNDFREEF